MAEMSNPVDVMGRELPYSQEAELAVIGSALTNSHSVAESVEILRPSDFYFPQNKEIFSVILDLFNENAAIDFITVSNKLSQSDKLEAVGGIAYLRNAATNVPTTRHMTYYSQIIKEKAVLRTLIKSAGDISEEELVKLVASVESDSTHPIAKAVVNYAKEQNIECVAVTGTKEFAGYGLEATIDGAMVLVGNCRLLSKFDISYPKELLEITDTIVVCAVGNRYAGYLLLADALKEDAKVAIDNLKALNIENIQILSGDKQSIVTNFAEKLGISKAYGDLLPEGKVNHLEELRQDEANRIAFVGDGMNDAPVLALSHVGIAMGGLGSDAAIETADVVIQTDQPSKVAEAIKVGKLTRRIIWQNVSLAFGVKLLVLILGAGGIATLWEAVFADVGVALLAIMNAVRIQKMIK